MSLTSYQAAPPRVFIYVDENGESKLKRDDRNQASLALALKKRRSSTALQDAKRPAGGRIEFTVTFWSAAVLRSQPLCYPLNLAPAVGFEPTTNRLTADRSTTELRWINILSCWLYSYFESASFLSLTLS
jgi:hypothetical protein